MFSLLIFLILKGKKLSLNSFPSDIGNQISLMKKITTLSEKSGASFQQYLENAIKENYLPAIIFI